MEREREREREGEIRGERERMDDGTQERVKRAIERESTFVVWCLCSVT